MFGFLSRFFRSSGRRSIEAASKSPRMAKAGSITSGNAAILAGAPTAGHRATYYARNNGYAARIVSSLVSNLIGCGIVPRSRHPDPAVRAAIQALWTKWAKAEGFYSKQKLAVRAMAEKGEAFCLLKVTAGPGVPLALDLIGREQVPMDRVLDFSAGSRVRAGIERDARNQVVAYHILPAPPDDMFPTLDALTPVRVPAEDVIHLFDEIEIGQLRGLSWLSPSVLRLYKLDGFEDAALTRAQTKSLFVGFMKSLEGDPSDPTYTPDTDLVMEPGSFWKLPMGADVTFADPGELGTGEYGGFVKAQLRGIAAGVGPGVPYEIASGDIEGVSYSSIRQSMLEFRRGLSQLQELTIIPRFCDPVWNRFIALAVLSGKLDAPDLGTNADDYLSVEWQPEGWDWVDPQSEVEAEAKALQLRLKSRAQAVASRGYDLAEVDSEIAADPHHPSPQGAANG